MIQEELKSAKAVHRDYTENKNDPRAKQEINEADIDYYSPAFPAPGYSQPDQADQQGYWDQNIKGRVDQIAGWWRITRSNY